MAAGAARGLIREAPRTAEHVHGNDGLGGLSLPPPSTRPVVMGGVARGGNSTPTSEFNVWTDPEAAHRVFAAGLPLTMVGLDVTDRSLVTPQDVKVLRTGGRIARFIAEAVDFYGRFHQDRYGTTDTYQHDALAVAVRNVAVHARAS